MIMHIFRKSFGVLLMAINPSKMNPDDAKVVYEQYWLHARHVERETWLFTSIYAVLIAAIFATMGSTVEDGIKLGLLFFGIILSLFGYSIVYILRVPFFKFAYLSEVIAINELKLNDNYRRFFPVGSSAGSEKKLYPDKIIDLHSILTCFFSILTGILFYSYLIIQKPEGDTIYFILSVILVLFLILFHYVVLVKKIYMDIKTNIQSYIEVTSNSSSENKDTTNADN
jgi:hypothetical protein